MARAGQDVWRIADGVAAMKKGRGVIRGPFASS